MSRSVELSDEEYDRLEQAAAAQGLTPAEWIAWRLSPWSRVISNANGNSGKSLAERAAGLIGVINSGTGLTRSDDPGECRGEGPEEQSAVRLLEQAAAAEGVTPAEWIVERLPPQARILSNSNGKPAKTLAERFAGRVGVIASGGKERLSERHSEIFGEILEEKRKAGRL